MISLLVEPDPRDTPLSQARILDLPHKTPYTLDHLPL